MYTHIIRRKSTYDGSPLSRAALFSFSIIVSSCVMFETLSISFHTNVWLHKDVRAPRLHWNFWRTFELLFNLKCFPFIETIYFSNHTYSVVRNKLCHFYRWWWSNLLGIKFLSFSFLVLRIPKRSKQFFFLFFFTLILYFHFFMFYTFVFKIFVNYSSCFQAHCYWYGEKERERKR